MKQVYEGKNVLVTGGAGFIGSHIVEELVKQKAKVTILDNFSSGTLTNLLAILPYINIIYGDISNPFTALKATKNQDTVFHLAALVSVAQSVENPQFCKQINLIGTKNLLEGCKKKGVKNFVFSSSSAIYGNRDEECKEEDSTKPLSPYAKYKLESEKLCKQYAKDYGINTASLRYFNVYGDRQKVNGEYAAVVAKFKYNLIHKKPLVIFGDGKQTRDFIHVSKVVEANLNIAIQANLNGEVFNIGSGKSINLLELIEQLEKEINTKKTDLVFEDERSGDIKFSSANCEKYLKLIG